MEETKWCVTYRDLRDKSTIAVIAKQGAAESYDAFVARMMRPGYDFPWDNCEIMDLTTGVIRGHLPASVLDPPAVKKKSKSRPNRYRG